MTRHEAERAVIEAARGGLHKPQNKSDRARMELALIAAVRELDALPPSTPADKAALVREMLADDGVIDAVVAQSKVPHSATAKALLWSLTNQMPFAQEGRDDG